MNRFISILFLAVLPVALVATVAAQDEVSLTLIPSGQTVEGALEGESTAMMFAFNAVEGDVVTVNLGVPPETTFTPVMLILGPAGQVEAAVDATATVTIPFSGSYFIVVTTPDSVNGTQVGQSPEEFDTAQAFTVSVSGNNPPASANNTLAFFRSPLEDGSSFEGYSSPIEPVYYFVFEGSANQNVDIVMTSGEIDSLLLVFDSTGRLVASNDDNPEMQLPGDRDAAISGFRLPEDGTYYVFATDVEYHTIPERLNSEDEDVDLFGGGDFVITLVR